MPNKVFSYSFTKFEWVSVALLEFKCRPKFDEGIIESYVHLNLVHSPCLHIFNFSFLIQDQYGTGIQCDNPSQSFSDDDDVLQRVHDSESIRLSSSFAELSNKNDQEKQQHQKVRDSSRRISTLILVFDPAYLPTLHSIRFWVFLSKIVQKCTIRFVIISTFSCIFQ